MKWRHCVVFGAALALALVGCGWGGAPSSPPPAPSVAPSAAPSAPRRPTVAATPGSIWGEPFKVTAGQARAVATAVAFLDAYNAGESEAALALLADDVIGSDCDYRAGAVIEFRGREAAAAWLRGRAADRDRLVVAAIENANPNQREGGSGTHVVGVAYARRTSDTLRALSFPDGIAPQSAAKVILDSGDERIGAFANGPVGGPPDACRLTPGARP